MNTSFQHKIIIVGGGPAGIATALHLAQRAPHLAADTLVLEAQEYPRPKLCGGGITFHGDDQLQRLGIHIDVPAFEVHRLVFRLGVRDFSITFKNAMRIIERLEFDAALAKAAQARGLQIRTGERLRDMHLLPEGGVELVTDRHRYRARVVVGADGANSTVRRKLKMFSTVGVARLLRTMTPVDIHNNLDWQKHAAIFDFSCIMHGIQGYSWDFPCYWGGKPYMNRGIFDSRIMPEVGQTRPQGHLKRTFDEGLVLRELKPDAEPLEGHPVRWFHPEAEFSRQHVLLVGDAAGVDPLFAEGISYAMEYGEIAAGMIEDAFARNDFSFADYRQILLNHHLGKMLQRRGKIASLFYTYRSPLLWSIFWGLAVVSPRAMKRFVGETLGVLPTGSG